MVSWTRKLRQKLNTKLEEQKGSAMAMVAWTIAILSIVAAGMGSLIVNEMIMIIQHSNRTRAYYLAEAGINYAVWELNQGEDGNVGSETEPVSLPEAKGTFYTRYDSNSGLIQAFATYSQTQRRISVKLLSGSGPNQFVETFATTDYKKRVRKTDWMTENNDGQQDKGELRLSGPGEWNYQWWSDIDSYDVQMFDADRGWVLGNGWFAGKTDSIVRWTENSGVGFPGWSAIWDDNGLPDGNKNGTSYALYGFHFVPDPTNPDDPTKAIGWAAGQKKVWTGNFGDEWDETAIVAKTTNGGRAWSIVYSYTSPNAYLSDVFFANDQVGWAVGSIIVRTTEGGDAGEWTRSNTSLLLGGVHFVKDPDQADNYLGWAVGTTTGISKEGRILHSSNSGQSWKNQGFQYPFFEFSSRPALNDIYFANDQLGWAVGEGGVAGGGTRIFILKTTNGGNKWEYKPTNVVDGYIEGLRSVHFVDEYNGWAVGRVYNYQGEGDKDYGLVSRTFDGGETWTSEKLADTANGLDVDELWATYFIDPDTGWTVGKNRKILKYSFDPPPFYVYDPSDLCYAYSKVVDVTEDDISSATLEPLLIGDLPAGTDITYYLAVYTDAQGEPQWEEVAPGEEHTFTRRGSELRWKAELSTTDPNVSPRIDRLTITYGSGDSSVSIDYSTWRSN